MASQISLMEDRGKLKYRVNIFKDGKIFGFIKPIDSFGERRQPPGGIPQI